MTDQVAGFGYWLQMDNRGGMVKGAWIVREPVVRLRPERMLRRLQNDRRRAPK